MKHRREYDIKLVGRNLRRLREKKNLSVQDVREYLCLGSVQAIYKYEAGRNYPQADVLFALLELYEADFRELICEQLPHCTFSQEGCWFIFAKVGKQLEMRLEVVIGRDTASKMKSGQFSDSLLSYVRMSSNEQPKKYNSLQRNVASIRSNSFLQ